MSIYLVIIALVVVAVAVALVAIVLHCLSYSFALSNYMHMCVHFILSHTHKLGFCWLYN